LDSKSDDYFVTSDDFVGFKVPAFSFKSDLETDFRFSTSGETVGKKAFGKFIYGVGHGARTKNLIYHQIMTQFIKNTVLSITINKILSITIKNIILSINDTNANKNQYYDTQFNNIHDIYNIKHSA
jgi:hypothetical protein